MILEKVRKIIAEQLGVDADQITEQTDIIEDLGADSLDVVELVMSLEEEFEIVIADESIQEFHTVGDVVAFLEESV